MSLLCFIFVLFMIGTLPRKRFLSGMAFNILTKLLTRVACHVNRAVGLFTPLEKGVTKKGVNNYRYGCSKGYILLVKQYFQRLLKSHKKKV